MVKCTTLKIDNFSNILLYSLFNILHMYIFVTWHDINGNVPDICDSIHAIIYYILLSAYYVNTLERVYVFVMDPFQSINIHTYSAVILSRKMLLVLAR